MKIASVSENRKIEKRIAITPEITKKYLSNGFQVLLSKDYGEHLGFTDSVYKQMGANIIEDEKKIINDADVIVQLNLPGEEKLVELKENQILVGILNPFKNQTQIDNLIKKKN